MYCEAALPPVRSPRPQPRAQAARRLLVGLLIALSIVVDASLFVTPRQGMSPHGLALLGCGLGQLSLVVVWAVTSRVWWLARMTAAIGGMAVLATLLSHHFPRTQVEFLGFLLAFAAAIAAPALLLRCMWREPTSVGGERRSISGALRPGGRRYSLAGLFAATTAVAMIAAVGRIAELPGENAVNALAHCGAFALVSLFALAPLLVHAHPGKRLAWMVLAMITAPVLGGLAGSLEAMPGRMAWTAICQGVYLGAAVWVLLTAGYRASGRDCVGFSAWRQPVS